MSYFLSDRLKKKHVIDFFFQQFLFRKLLHAPIFRNSGSYYYSTIDYSIDFCPENL